MDAIHLTPEETELLNQIVAAVATIKEKLDVAGVPARGVLLRADYLPQMATIYGLPRIRTAEESSIRWGIVA